MVVALPTRDDQTEAFRVRVDRNDWRHPYISSSNAVLLDSAIRLINVIAATERRGSLPRFAVWGGVCKVRMRAPAYSQLSSLM